MNDITITVNDGNKTLTITNPSDIPLISDNDSWYSWRAVFATILTWLGWEEDYIKQLMPDREECEIEAYDNCQYKRDGLSDGTNDGINEGVSEGVFEGVNEEKSCDDCKYAYFGIGEQPCKDCCDNEDIDYAKWEPKEPPILTDYEEKSVVKDCDNCKYGDLDETATVCMECINNEDVDYSNWQPVSTNAETNKNNETNKKLIMT